MLTIRDSSNKREVASAAETCIELTTQSSLESDIQSPHEDTWVGRDYDVILLDYDLPDGFTLRSLLQAMGVQVFFGAHFLPTDSKPLIMLHARHRHRADISERIACARQIFPSATVLFVTGNATPHFSSAEFDDARGLLCAVGISFVT